jgi:hypothetical protein
MSSTNAPFGLVPSFHPSGLDRAVALTDGIASAYNTAILKGQPVQLDTNGNLIIATTSSSLQGAFAGVQWTDTTGRVRISNNWPANTAYIAGSCIAYYYSDPQIVYLIQADGPVLQAGLGDQANFSNIAAGSTVTGLSQCTLSNSLVGAAGTAQMKIVGLYGGIDNAWGDAYTVVQVQINKSQFQATVVAI